MTIKDGRASERIDEMTTLLSKFHFIEVWELTLSAVHLHILGCNEWRWLFSTTGFLLHCTWFFLSNPLTAFVSACLWSLQWMFLFCCCCCFFRIQYMMAMKWLCGQPLILICPFVWYMHSGRANTPKKKQNTHFTMLKVKWLCLVFWIFQSKRDLCEL